MGELGAPGGRRALLTRDANETARWFVSTARARAPAFPKRCHSEPFGSAQGKLRGAQRNAARNLQSRFGASRVGSHRGLDLTSHAKRKLEILRCAQNDMVLDFSSRLSIRVICEIRG